MYDQRKAGITGQCIQKENLAINNKYIN